MKNKPQRINLSGDPNQLPDIPLDILIEILSRLPVKSLLRFRLVNKLWRWLVSDPKFINTHRKVSAKSKNVIFSSSDHALDYRSCSLNSIFSKPSVQSLDLNFLCNNSIPHFWMVGHCDGLVCVATRGDIYLWNPSTRESKRLPDFRSADGNPTKLTNGFGDFRLCGFGYDNSSNDYKVVLDNGVYGYCYMMRKNSWRRIQAYPQYLFFSNCSIYVNGALHWNVTPSSCGESREIILSLDLAKETFSELPQPNYGDGFSLNSMGVLEQCLCVVSNNYHYWADLWVMKEYGVRESWTKLKLFKLPYMTSSISCVQCEPLSFAKNGEIVLQYGSDLILYNPKNSIYKFPMITRFHLHDGHSYVESLVSPNA